ncbi:zinc-binding dehydrogenase [Sporosarcina sp. ANT_H38]|uniref:zinc-dependent alcohol dehydrogenase n=1 Tax=Sporosarcina sp. ANT_H38 TaxID=2597358 RepID=UPI0011F0EE47|nr:alcohol dehydrogenase catalytic domain-containing protein [Sporosarcina sp. ANT_H38]KAA0967065.1 zinc-binding dehydrogenase [Sporosarcina sp. ANT_H38]
MKAGQYLSEKKLGLSQIEKPSVKDGEALVKVSFAGICGTDMMIYFGKHPRAKAPLTMGHEFSGVIEEIADGSSFTIGDRVVVEPTISCGQCPACQSGHANVCKTLRLIGIDMDGGFAEYVAVPINRLHKIPDELPASIAAFTEPVAVAVHSVRKSDLLVGENVAILGAGPIGLLIGMVAKLNGANNIFISDISPYRLAKAEELGFISLDARKVNVTEEILSRTNGHGVDVVFEVAGSQITANQMVEIVKTRGQIVVVSVFKQPPTIDFAKMHYNEISLTTTRCYSRDDFSTAISLMAQGKIDVAPIISHELPIEELEQGFSLMGNPDESLKILIKPSM